MVLAIDPGYSKDNGCGWALFHEERLIGCGVVAGCTDDDARKCGIPGQTVFPLYRTSYVANRVQGAIVECAENNGLSDIRNGKFPNFIMIAEFPRVYPGRGKGENPNDLLPLACLLGAMNQFVQGVNYTYLPREWKGIVPKPKPGKTYVIETRVKDRLNAKELAIYEEGAKRPRSKQLDMNVTDAVGIGLKFLDRFEPKKVYPR